MSLLRSSLIVGSMTMLSRVFGFVRDVLVANILGASILTDAFFVAFKLPNLLRRLFAEGAFNAAFLPMFAGMLKKDGKDVALRFASHAASFLSLILIVVSMAAIAAMPFVIMIIAPGFEHGSDLFTLTVELSRITFPYLFFISLVCLLGGVLNSVGKFAAVAATPILMNIAIIFALLFLRESSETGAHALAYGVLIAGIAQFLWLVVACIRAGMLPRFAVPQLTPNIKKLLVIIGPAALGAGVAQINILIDMIIASKFENAVSFLYYADRLYELPLGVIGVAVATALLPTLSGHIQAGEHAEASQKTDQAITLVMLLGIPSCFALLSIADPIIQVIFEHGAFDAADRAATAPALIAYAAGIPAFLLIKIFATHFYAAQDTKTPVKIATLCVGVNLVLNLILMQYIQHVGLAVATSIAGWLNALLMGLSLSKRGAYHPAPAVFSTIGKLITSALVMVVVLELVRMSVSSMLDAPHIPVQAFALIAIVGSGIIIYFATVFATEAISPQAVKQMLRKS